MEIGLSTYTLDWPNGASYQALVFPNMSAVRWSSLVKAAEFADAEGRVYAVGGMPCVSDRAGRNDADLDSLVQRTFPPSRRMAEALDAVEAIAGAFVQNVQGLRYEGDPASGLFGPVQLRSSDWEFH